MDKKTMLKRGAASVLAAGFACLAADLVYDAALSSRIEAFKRACPQDNSGARYSTYVDRGGYVRMRAVFLARPERAVCFRPTLVAGDAQSEAMSTYSSIAVYFEAGAAGDKQELVAVDVYDSRVSSAGKRFDERGQQSWLGAGRFAISRERPGPFAKPVKVYDWPAWDWRDPPMGIMAALGSEASKDVEPMVVGKQVWNSKVLYVVGAALTESEMWPYAVNPAWKPPLVKALLGG